MIDLIERAGLPEDAKHAAALIYQADQPYYDYWFALPAELILANLALLWRAQEGSYSHRQHQLWLQHGKLVALAAHYPAERTALLAAQLNSQLDLLPLDATILHQRAADLAWLFPQLPTNVWYLRTLAVAPAVRGHGCGHRILRDITLMAEAAGAAALHTDVDSGNPRAVAFYQRYDFETVAETRVPMLEDFNLPASLHMVRRFT